MKTTITYKKINDCEIKADIFYQNTSDPVLIYIHGGALIWGTRASLPNEQIELFNSAGYTVASIDYRLAPETMLEQIAEDIRDSIVWAKTSLADQFGFDPERVGVMGCSAGGYLCLLSGIFEVKPKVVVSLYGYGDILGDWYCKPSAHYCQMPMVELEKAMESIGREAISEGTNERMAYYLYCRQHGNWVNNVSGYDPVNDKSKLMNYNPIDNVTGSYPPTLLLHGTADTDVPYQQSRMMHQALQEAGVHSEMITLEGLGHVFDRDFRNQIVRDAFHQVVKFLKTYL